MSWCSPDCLFPGRYLNTVVGGPRALQSCVLTPAMHARSRGCVAQGRMPPWCCLCMWVQLPQGVECGSWASMEPTHLPMGSQTCALGAWRSVWMGQGGRRPICMRYLRLAGSCKGLLPAGLLPGLLPTGRLAPHRHHCRCRRYRTAHATAAATGRLPWLPPSPAGRDGRLSEWRLIWSAGRKGVCQQGQPATQPTTLSDCGSLLPCASRWHVRLRTDEVSGHCSPRLVAIIRLLDLSLTLPIEEC